MTTPDQHEVAVAMEVAIARTWREQRESGRAIVVSELAQAALDAYTTLREAAADPRQNDSIIRSSPEADSIDGAEEREDERQFAILVCPECGEQTVFSAMDANHGVEARCYRHGMEETAGGGMQVKRGPELVPLIVVPKRQLEQVQAERTRLTAALEDAHKWMKRARAWMNHNPAESWTRRRQFDEATSRAAAALSPPPEQQGEER